MDGLIFANGVTLSGNEGNKNIYYFFNFLLLLVLIILKNLLDYLLVSESGRYRIHRYWIKGINCNKIILKIKKKYKLFN